MAVTLAALALALSTPAPAGARSGPRGVHLSAHGRRPRAPTGPPLRSPALGPGGEGQVETSEGQPETPESQSATPASAGDVLALNGLDSPFCGDRSGLPASAQRNCDLAHFLVDPYPTDNYMFDVNIDTGIAKWSNDAVTVVQNLAQLGWMALVSLVRGLVVMLEWCYSLGAASQRMMGQASGRLRAAGLGFTEPLLAVALAVAGTLAAFHGLVRRRASETLGKVLATLAMMGAGFWLIVDPAGTVGALQQWSDEAGAGALAVAAAGAPGQPRGTLTDGLGRVFGVVVTAPWCYLEFGAVDWCESPRRLDGRLKVTALRIAAKPAQRSSGRLLADAQTNGQLFLALPAERTQRNSAKAPGTLLNVLCGGAQSAEHCRGPTASQAEFRGASGTYGRVVGLLLIWAGALGLLLLFGFFALRLLLCGVATVGYLLLAPAAVLIPVFGDGGRDAFALWMRRLLMAAVSKLAYSFLLGVALTATSLLLGFDALGWWARWLLLSAFWWTAFLKRHHALAIVPRPRQNVAVQVRRGGGPRLGRGIRRLARRAS